VPQHSSDKSTEPFLYCVPALFGRVGMLGATGRDRGSKQVREATLIDVKGASRHRIVKRGVAHQLLTEADECLSTFMCRQSRG
jgi:hypothetical protein